MGAGSCAETYTYIVMAYVVMTHVVMVYIDMAHIVTSYTVMEQTCAVEMGAGSCAGTCA